MSTLVHFLDSVPDDPENCVTYDVMDRIAEIEKKLVWLEVGGVRLLPEKLMYCNHVDAKSQFCNGPEADDTLLTDDIKMMAGRSELPAGEKATLHRRIGYSGEVTGIFVEESGQLPHALAPTRVVRQGDIFPLERIRGLRYPILIVILRGHDSLGIRKFVWFL